MAADFGVYFSSARLPSVAKWEHAAAELGIRLRVMPVDLTAHAGMLPVAFEADDYNSGFEFQLRHDWGRDVEHADLLSDRDCFAHFRCFGREFPAAVWAAVSFSNACGGVFQDPMGETIPKLEDAVAFAQGVPVHGPEFFFEGEPVGFFFGADGPRTLGPHHFEPCFGAGYSKMNNLLREGGSPRCYYDDAGERIWFSVKERTYSDVLELDDFERRNLGSTESGAAPGRRGF